MLKMPAMLLLKLLCNQRTEGVATAAGNIQLTEGQFLTQKLETKLSEAGDTGNWSLCFYFDTIHDRYSNALQKAWVLHVCFTIFHISLPTLHGGMKFLSPFLIRK